MPLTPEDLLLRLEDCGIAAKTYRHPPLHTVEESKRLRGDIPGAHVKNLFLKDEKGALFLITALESTQIELKGLHRRIGSRRLSFGREELLFEALGVRPGSVTPFALVNDTARKVTFLLDQVLLAYDLIAAHPLSNEATTVVTRDDLMRFFAHTGHMPRMIDFAVAEPD